MNETELSVVCKSCGAEVSPYVTECPYCGTRLRKRAPELERRDGGLEPKRSRRERRRERKRAARARRRNSPTPDSRAERFSGTYSLAALILLAVPAIALVVRIAFGWSPIDFGALVVPIEQSWWRFLATPFVYGSIGYAFVVGLVLAVFVPGIERRLGTVPTLLLLVACGVLGAVAAYGIGTAVGGVTVISGGNGIALGAIAAWYFTSRTGIRSSGEAPDLAGLAVCAAVVLLLPLVVDGVSAWAGLVGGLTGALGGLLADRAGRRSGRGL
ncbi:MAG: rhomboid family intramembrane serine protease [Solirubrobacterales bacterium]|nr:rhomboid family intramembrane serine protease [Solirubrobacterales bacterium]